MSKPRKANWQLGKIVDYWDQRVQAIDTLSRQLEAVADEQREAQLKQIHAAILSRAAELADEDLVLASFVMMDDLYKAVSVLSAWDDALADYLGTSVGAFLSVLHGRGYAIHYVVDNAFEQSAAGMNGPLEWYPAWFRTAGLKYICPQAIAPDIMKHDGYTAEQYFQQLPRYIREARLVANTVVARCHDERDSYLFLDTDSVPASFAAPNSAMDAPGVIHVFRNEPPVQGSQCAVNFPKTNMNGATLDQNKLAAILAKQ
jgi:hypothetical protein